MPIMPTVVKTKVEPVRLTLRCACEGEMKVTGSTGTSVNMKYHHQCDKCDNRVWLSSSYPRIEYRDLKADTLLDQKTRTT